MLREKKVEDQGKETKANSKEKRKQKISMIEQTLMNYNYCNQFLKKQLTQFGEKIKFEREQKEKEVREKKKQSKSVDKQQELIEICKPKKKLKSKIKRNKQTRKELETQEPTRRSVRSIKSKPKMIQIQSSQISQSDEILAKSSKSDKQQSFKEDNDGLQPEGTYELTATHQAILQLQKQLDMYLTYKFSYRRERVVPKHDIIKYLARQGFGVSTEDLLNQLFKLNPDLYHLVSQESNLIIKLTQYSQSDIQDRLNQTRRRMTMIKMNLLI